MKQVQKRYIYAAIMASIFFLILYIVLSIIGIDLILRILVSVLLTIGIYIGGILFFKKEDVRELTGDNINNYYYLASKVNNEANRTEDENIIKTAEEIAKLTDNILVSLSQRPKKVESTFDFFDYYLDISYKILYRYNSIKNKEEQTKEDKKFITSTKKYLDNILNAFKKQSKNMQEAKMLDIDTEIKIFEKTSGIDKENIKVGDKNE